MSTRTVLRGMTAIETLTRPPTAQPNLPETKYEKLICIPSQRTGGGERSSLNGCVFRVHPDERIYDLGPRLNWKLFLDQPLFHKHGNLCVDLVSFESLSNDYSREFYVWPKLNPRMLQRMRNIDSIGNASTLSRPTTAF
jgi:hypothetical protein